jgi:hypothetical protein
LGILINSIERNMPMRRLPAILAMTLLLPAGCAVTTTTTKPADTVAERGTFIDDSRVTIRLGESSTLSDGSQLSYTGLINDSRCAPDVQCIWAGDAEIALRWKPARGNAKDVRLHTNPQAGATSTRLGERRLTLVSLERGVAPKATLTINSVH